MADLEFEFEFEPESVTQADIWPGTLAGSLSVLLVHPRPGVSLVYLILLEYITPQFKLATNTTDSEYCVTQY